MSITLVVVSPRAPVGLLSWPAWAALRAADEVLAADLDPGWSAALAEAGVKVRDVAALPVTERAGSLLTASDGDPARDPDAEPDAEPDSGHDAEPDEGGRAVWFGSPDGDPGLTDALAEHLSRRAVAGRPPTVEIITGSHDVPGARLLDLVAVMDRLRSPGGCPWDREQTHRSLLPFLLEEAYELIEAVENEDRAHVREELGDVLMQVAFHARVAQEHPDEPFSIDDVAGGIVEKLVRRHPHVFSDTAVESAAEVERNWEAIKAEEKRREGVFDGIPAGLPALARAQKMLGRAARAGLAGPEFGGGPEPAAQPAGTLLTGGDEYEKAERAEEIAAQLLGLVRQAEAAGVDAEGALRAVLTRWSAAGR